MLSRREFVGTASRAGLGVAFGAHLQALPGDKFRWAMSSHMFTPLTPHPEMGIKMAAKFGFHGIEPWGNELQKYLTQPPEVFKQLLDESGISISSVASGGEYFDTTKLQATLDNNGANAKFASYFGVTALKANLGRRPGPENLSSANGRILAKNLNEVGKRTLEHGVKFAFHPHAWTIVERKAEVDMILEMTDPKLVFMTLDTCHASVGGIESVAFARDNYSRLAHLHFKDTLPVWSAGKGWKGPAPSKEEEAAMAAKLGLPKSPDAIYQRLGTGGVDFPGLIRVLRERNYAGWISLDFNYVDMPPGVSIEQDMAAHRNYLVETLHASLKT
ncbi:MAG: sugar phosphate isomerase/epimerase family protein [Vicinamibacterales bacterium]